LSLSQRRERKREDGQRYHASDERTLSRIIERATSGDGATRARVAQGVSHVDKFDL